MQKITVLGSTGSIGCSTLDVIARHEEMYQVFALTANQQADKLLSQCLQFNPEYAVLLDEQQALWLIDQLKPHTQCRTQVLTGAEALKQVAADGSVDIVMAAIVGAAGLEPTLAAAHAGKKILLANKETLVMAGSVFMEAVQDNAATLLPIDSEHNAIFQAMPTDYCGTPEKHGIRRLLLTASGGPFRETPLDDLKQVTPEQACNHPNWQMGRKISVDSATMMNKGLEVIEAHWLFNVDADDIQVVVHPQSVIHSMVDYVDGSVIAQLGNPDMRTPIAYGLAWPERIKAGVEPLDLFQVASMDFSEPDFKRFPCLDLAYRALRLEGTAPAILNAANEQAVEAFLDGRIGFSSIPKIIEAVLEALPVGRIETLDDVLQADQMAREVSGQLIRSVN